MSNGNQEALDDQIALLRRQISDLTDQATAASGASAEERLAGLITEKQERLDELLKQRAQVGSS